MAAQVRFQLARSHRRIDWDRDAAGKQYAHEGDEVAAVRRQHQRHRIARSDSAVPQAVGNTTGSLEQGAVRQLVRREVLVEKGGMHTIGVGAGVALEDLDQGVALECDAAFDVFVERLVCTVCSNGHAASGGALIQRAEKILQRRCLCHRSVGKRYLAHLFEAGK